MSLIEKSVEEALHSLENISRAQMDSELRQKVLNCLHRQPERVISIQPRTMWRAAAAIALLIGLNIFSFAHFDKAIRGSAGTGTNVFVQEYFSFAKQAQF